MLRAGVALRVEVVLNRNARGLRGESPLSQRLALATERSGARLHATSSVEELHQVVREMASREVDAVVFAGGDGTCTAGLSALARVYEPERLPLIAIAPAGTVGTIARNLGLAARRDAERVIASVSAGSVRRTPWPTLRVRDGSGEDRIGFIFGAGLVARFFEVYEAGPRRGLARAAQIAVRVFAGSFVGTPLSRRILMPLPCVLSVDGRAQPAGAWSLVVASVLADVGLHLRVTYRAREDPNRFHLVASGLAPRALGPQLPRVLAGRPLRGAPHVDVLARSATVDFVGDEGSYVLDGELVRAKAVTVLPGPRISLLLPFFGRA